MKFFLISLWITFASAGLFAQSSTQREITTVLPFLTMTPDAKSGGIGDGGVATSPDVNALYWNIGKLPFVENKAEATIAYTPWLSDIVNDMYLAFAAGQFKIDSFQSIGISLRYFKLGEFEINDENGALADQFNSDEAAFGISYARKLSQNLGLGLTASYIRSDIPGQFALIEDLKVGHTVAFDMGLYYSKGIQLFHSTSNFAAGLQISNIGPKLSYDNGLTKNFIPTLLRLGFALDQQISESHNFMIAVGASKLLVPSTPLYGNNDQGILTIVEGKDPNRSLISGIFGSFSDAPGGFSEEIQEISFSFGLEYQFQELLALRMGYFHENKWKGNRKYLTFGVGSRYQSLQLDFSYLVPTISNHPLANTLRVSLTFEIE